MLLALGFQRARGSLEWLKRQGRRVEVAGGAMLVAVGIFFLDKTGVTYPSGFDPSGSLAATFGVMGMPTTVFISPEGTVLDTRSGELSREELERTISRLFAVS